MGLCVECFATVIETYEGKKIIRCEGGFGKEFEYEDYYNLKFLPPKCKEYLDEGASIFPEENIPLCLLFWLLRESFGQSISDSDRLADE